MRRYLNFKEKLELLNRHDAEELAIYASQSKYAEVCTVRDNPSLKVNVRKWLKDELNNYHVRMTEFGNTVNVAEPNISGMLSGCRGFSFPVAETVMWIQNPFSAYKDEGGGPAEQLSSEDCKVLAGLYSKAMKEYQEQPDIENAQAVKVLGRLLKIHSDEGI